MDTYVEILIYRYVITSCIYNLPDVDRIYKEDISVLFKGHTLSTPGGLYTLEIWSTLWVCLGYTGRILSPASSNNHVRILPNIPDQKKQTRIRDT